MDIIHYRMIYKEKNYISKWYLNEIDARDKGIIDIYYQAQGMRWYEREYCVLETKIFNSNESMYLNKNKYFQNIF